MISTLAAVGVFLASLSGAQTARITIDYPADGSIFPPEITAPTFLWRDPVETNKEWRIDVTFTDGSPAIHSTSRGERMALGEIDPRAVSPSNRPPELSAQQAAAYTWTPDTSTWAEIKHRSVKGPAIVAITAGHSIGHVKISTSADPVGAPIFYRDVPLMPSEVALQGGFLGKRVDANVKNRMLKVDETDMLDAFERFIAANGNPLSS